MKSTELRIGNYIEYAGVICEVEEIHKKTITTDGVNAPVSSFLSIPLTEEWLLKFGFEKTPLGFKRVIGKKRELSLSLCNDKGEGEFYFYIRDNEDFAGFNMRLFKVHQLQNLYFALTGEELTLKQTEST